MLTNELLLLLSILLLFGLVLLFYYLFGIPGLYCWTVFATIAANIEVLLLVNAFGMEQTLGNVMFASTFLATDIISEMGSKEKAGYAVSIGILTSASFILVSQLWLYFIPSPNDWAMPHIRAVFSNTPRLMLTSFVVYALCQRFDVWAYHKWWALTTKKSGNSKSYLWLRNNGSTLISQLLNSILFTLGAFGGIYDAHSLLGIIASSYVIFIFTSLLDTPVIYLARKLKPRTNTV